MRPLTLEGRVFGRLIVVSRSPSIDGKSAWLCRCGCGSEKTIRARSLVNGQAQSCGCRRREISTENGKRNRRHGMEGSPEYRCWHSMRGRCLNSKDKDYAKYGGRGVTVCDRWHKFENFYADVGPRPSPQHSIDRINNDGDYEPGNVRWATPDVQGNNKRNNIVIEHAGRSMTLAEWSSETGLAYSLLHHRVRRGLPPEKILERISSNVA